MPDFLAPLSDAQPCGSDLSFSTEFDEILELRREDDPTLDQGEWVTAIKAAEWPAVVSRCEELLSKRTKDLRLLAWRTEALAHTQGYKGLTAGLHDVVEVCKAFWAHLHPQIEDGDIEQRAGTLRWLLMQVERLSQRLPVTEGQSGRYTLVDFDNARQLQTAIEKDPDQAASLSEGKVTLVQVQRARSNTPHAFLLATLDALTVARADLQALQDLVDPQLGDDAPSFVHARQALENARHAVERHAREVGAIQTEPAAGQTPLDDAVPTHAGGVATGPAPLDGPLATRTQALQQLRRVAEYFRRTEPHSPVAPLVEKAVRWGAMPLEEWLREVVKDPASMTHLEELLVGKPKADGAAG